MPFLPFNNIERIPPKEILSKLKDNVSEVTARIKENQQKNIRKHRTLALQPKTLHNGTLKEYQLEALTWMIELFEKGMNGILADDMGLGKTIQTLSFIAYLQEKFGIKGKHLIVAPKNVLRNW